MAKAYPTCVPGDILEDRAKKYFLDALTDYDFKVKAASYNPRNVSAASSHALGLEHCCHQIRIRRVKVIVPAKIDMSGRWKTVVK
jgi:hypothetical protein